MRPIWWLVVCYKSLGALGIDGCRDGRCRCSEWVANSVKAFLLLVLLSVSPMGLSDQIDKNDKALTPAVVLDFEILGDTSIESLKLEDQMLIERFSEVFRERLKQQSVFNVIDDKQSLALLEKESQRRFLHRCNGCELDLARQLGAKIVIVPWVFRMSVLVQTMHIEIRDVETGGLIMKKPYNFRGNSDSAWEHAMRYAFKDLKQSAERVRERGAEQGQEGQRGIKS